MASEQETLIYVEANDKAEAGALAKGGGDRVFPGYDPSSGRRYDGSGQ